MFNQSVIPFQWYHWFSYIFQGSLTVMCKRNSRNRKSAIFISGRSTSSPGRSCYNVLYRGYGIPFVQALYRALYSVEQGGMPTPEQSQNRKGCEILPSCLIYFNYLILLIFKESNIIVKCQAHETIIMMELNIQKPQK